MSIRAVILAVDQVLWLQSRSVAKFRVPVLLARLFLDLLLLRQIVPVPCLENNAMGEHAELLLARNVEPCVTLFSSIELADLDFGVMVVRRVIRSEGILERRVLVVTRRVPLQEALVLPLITDFFMVVLPAVPVDGAELLPFSLILLESLAWLLFSLLLLKR